MLKWFLRRGLWDFIAWGKFFVQLSRSTSRCHRPSSADIRPKPMVEAIP